MRRPPACASASSARREARRRRRPPRPIAPPAAAAPRPPRRARSGRARAGRRHPRRRDRARRRSRCPCGRRRWRRRLDRACLAGDASAQHARRSERPSRRRGRPPQPPPEVIRPPRLAPGDPVRVIAPSGPVPREAFAAGIEVLRARYDVRYDDGVFARDGYLAGSDERRLAELTGGARRSGRARDRDGARRLRPAAAVARSSTPARWRAGRGRSSASPTGRRCWRCAARAGVASIHGPVVTQLGNLPPAISARCSSGWRRRARRCCSTGWRG